MAAKPKCPTCGNAAPTWEHTPFCSAGCYELREGRDARKREGERGRLLALDIERMESRLVGKGAPRINTEHRGVPVCPRCGREQTAHVNRGPREGDAFEVCCPRCKTTMIVTAHVTVTYSTEVRS